MAVKFIRIMKKIIIIAEAGVNHNGKFELAKKLINEAKKSGADYVKFQSFDAEEIAIKNLKKTKYQIRNSDARNENQFKMLKKLQLSEKVTKKIYLHCKKKKIKFLSSVFDLKSLNNLKKYKMDFYKIASSEITNFPLLKSIAKLKKRIILSTGMSNLKEIKNSLKVLVKYGCKKKNICLLHCNSSYPTPLKDANILAIKYLKDKLKINVGYSDHTLGLEASLGAVALGAKIIEKHITINNNLKGPDHKSSMNTNTFFTLVKSIKNLEIALGNEKKNVTKSELENRDLVRKSIVASRNIKIGEKFSINNITTKRPGLGISPMKIMSILGKKSKFNFKRDNLIKLK